MSTFSGLNTATTALWAQQRGMEVTGQNVANVNTPGYSRQRAELQSIGGSAVPALWSTSNGIGQGVGADSVIRMRDAFLEARAQTEASVTAGMTVSTETLAQIEQAFREPGETGIQAKLTSVFTAWGDVASHPTEDGARAAVLQKTASLVAELHTTGASLDRQWVQTRDSLDVLAQDATSKLRSIADLNTAIKRATQAGLPANEFADKRDALVLDLAAAIGATSVPGADGQVDVLVGGSTVISGGSSTGLRVVGGREPTAPGDVAFVTDPGGTRLAPGGTAGGKLAVLQTTIPAYRAQLDGVARQIAAEFNTAHSAGYDQAGVRGEPLFDDGSGTLPVDPSTITAANLTLRITDTRKLAAAAVGPGPTSDNGAATAIGTLHHAPAGAAVGYRKLIVSLGVESSVAAGNLQTQTVISNQVDVSRESVAGVNLDEEMTNMLRFQHAYSAAARMISAIDEALDVLINRTGRVGL